MMPSNVILVSHYSVFHRHTQYIDQTVEGVILLGSVETWSLIILLSAYFLTTQSYKQMCFESVVLYIVFN